MSSQSPLKSNQVISLIHNDLDGFGCRLSINSKFGQDVKFFDTNYKNLSDRVQSIIEYCGSNIIKLIIISDVSFSDSRHLLELLDDIGTPIIYFDHHLYPENFQEGFKNIKFVIDKSKSASKITYESLQISDDRLKDIISWINDFDLWKSDSKEFALGFYLNNYFWEFKPQKISQVPSLSELAKYALECKKKSSEYIENLHTRNLIYTINNTLVVFTDKFYQEIVLETFKGNIINTVIILNSWGNIKVRFRDSFSSEVKEFIKSELIGNISGHENAFSYSTEPGLDNMIEEVKKICNLVK